MNNLVRINNQKITIKEWNGRRVVTFADIDSVHNRPKGTASRNFRENKSRFIEGEDYMLATIANAKKDEIRSFGIPPRGLTVLTESGYLMLVKSFTDDLAWKVQRELVNNYFKVRTITSGLNTTTKYYKGKPVMVGRDLEKLFNQSKEEINYIAVSYNIGTILDSKSLIEFKKENPTINMKYVSVLRVFNRGDVVNLATYGNLRYNSVEVSEYFDRSDLNDYDRFRLLELAKDIQNVAKMRGYNTPYEKMLNMVASKIYVDCGFLNEVADDLSTHKPIGWNMQQPLIDFRGKIRKKLIE